MTPYDIILLAVVGAVIIVALVLSWRRKRSGKGCCSGNCGACSCGCGGEKPKQ